MLTARVDQKAGKASLQPHSQLRPEETGSQTPVAQHSVSCDGYARKANTLLIRALTARLEALAAETHEVTQEIAKLKTCAIEGFASEQQLLTAQREWHQRLYLEKCRADLRSKQLDIPLV